MGWRSTLARLLCLALMVSAVLWPLHGRAKAAEVGKAEAQKHGCCKGETPQASQPAKHEDDCCKHCAFGMCCLRVIAAERGIAWMVTGDVVDVPGVGGPVVLIGLVQLQDIFHPPRA